MNLCLSFVHCNICAYFPITGTLWVKFNTHDKIFICSLHGQAISFCWGCLQTSVTFTVTMWYSSFSSLWVQDVTLKRRLQEQDIAQKLILDSDSGKKLSIYKCHPHWQWQWIRLRSGRLYPQLTFMSCSPQLYHGPSENLQALWF